MVMTKFFYYAKATPAKERTPLRDAIHAVNPAQAFTNKKLAKQVADPSSSIGKILSCASIRTPVDVEAIDDIPPSPPQGMLPKDPPRIEADLPSQKIVDVEGSSPPLVCKKSLASRPPTSPTKRHRSAAK